MLRFIQITCSNIQRIIKWIPFLWKDRDWDSVYLFHMMRFKISLIRKNVKKEMRHVGWEKQEKNMRIVEELLKRAAFSQFHWDNYIINKDREKEGNCICPDETAGWRSLPGGSSLYIDEHCEFCKKHWMRWSKEYDKKINDDWEYLWKLINKESRRWWN